jgi:hypothetical protein
MTMPTCRVCHKKWYGKPTSTICGNCVAEMRAIDTTRMRTIELDNNVEEIKNRSGSIGYADRVKAHRRNMKKRQRRRRT